MLPNLVGLILALAKLAPFLNRLLDAIEDERAERNRKRLYGLIDEAVADAKRAPRVCAFSDCPFHRVREPAQPGGGAPQTP